MRLRRWPIWRVISRTIPGVDSSRPWNTPTGIFQTWEGCTVAAKLSRGKSPNTGSSPNTSPGAT